MTVLRAAVLCLTFPALQAAAQSNARESLRAADERVGSAAFESGLASALTASAAEDVVFLYDGAPLVKGRANVNRLLAEQPGLRDVRISWSPLRVFVSRDGSLGVTFGTTIAAAQGRAPALSRYISVWRRDDSGTWKLVAQVQSGLVSPREFVSVSNIGVQASPLESDDPFAIADGLFAREARTNGAPLAFERFAAPDAITFAGTGELNVGPPAIRARLQEGPAGAAAWDWRPVLSFSAASGDLGATIGEAEITLPNADRASYSKYLTVWTRQPDGSIKFVVDGGAARPAPR